MSELSLTLWKLLMVDIPSPEAKAGLSNESLGGREGLVGREQLVVKVSGRKGVLVLSMFFIVSGLSGGNLWSR